MEVYSGNPQSVTIPLPAGFGTATVELLKGEERITYGNPSSFTSNSITVDLPYRSVREDTTLTIKVGFDIDSFVEMKTLNIDVVTPLIPLSEVKAIMKPNSPDSVTDQAAGALERKVRLAVQSYTGQVFGRYSGTLRVLGTGDQFLKLPRRAVSVSNVNYGPGVYAGSDLIVQWDGWGIAKATREYWEIKDAPPEPILDAFLTTSVGPIVSPRVLTTFSRGIVHTVSGVFGYEEVPYNVQEAARILVNDYGCNESLYRERYIANIRAADWRFEFNPKAYLGTGNVLADQLLADYQRNIMVVI